MASYIPSATDSTRPFDSDDPSVGAAELRGIKARVNQLAGAAAIPVSQTLNQSSLKCLLYPGTDGWWRDIYKGGWTPGFLNQQWGASTVGYEITDAATETNIRFESAQAQINVSPGSAEFNINDTAARTYVAFNTKLGATKTIQAVWLKLAKTLNPSNSVTLRIVADDGTGLKPSGIVPITNGTANIVSPKVVPSRTVSPGEFVRFVFAIPPTLVAGTIYWIVVSTSALDATNIPAIAAQAQGVFQHPISTLYSAGDASGVFATSTLVNGGAFYILESTQAAQFFAASAGQFDGALKFSEGSIITTSEVITKPLKDFFDSRHFTALHRISGAVKGKPIADYIYGIDNNRITVQCPLGTGAVQVTIYDDAGNVQSILGTTDVTVTTLSDIAIHARMVGDGADFIQLWVNGFKEAETSLQTYVMSPSFSSLGICWLGGGFPLAPVWTNTLDMSVLPSAAGYSFTGTATESAVMSAINGKLHQVGAGYGATQTGVYLKSGLGFSNATGGTVRAKIKIKAGSNTPATGVTQSGATISVSDGTKLFVVNLGDWYLQGSSLLSNALYNTTILTEAEHELLLVFKLNSYWVFLDGKLVLDGTENNTSANAANQLLFGANSAVSGDHSDMSWGKVSYSTSPALLPQVSTGMLLHEYAFWSGDKTSLLSTLWNSGIQVAVKTLTGIANNYVTAVKNSITVKCRLTATALGTSPISLLESNIFILGEEFEGEANFGVVTSAPAVSQLGLNKDGNVGNSTVTAGTTAAAFTNLVLTEAKIKKYFGLHYFSPVLSATANGLVTLNNQRECIIRSKE